MGRVGEMTTPEPEDTDTDEFFIGHFSNQELVKSMPFLTPRAEGPYRETRQEARRAVSNPGPAVGSGVLVHGRKGQVLRYDPRDPSLMYKVYFEDGTADWLSHADVCMEVPPRFEDAPTEREQEAAILREKLRRAYEEEKQIQELQAERDRQKLPKQESTRPAAEQAKHAQTRLREVLSLADERESIERGLGCSLCQGQCDKVYGVPSYVVVDKCQRCGFTTKVTEAGWISGALEHLAGMFICQCR